MALTDEEKTEKIKRIIINRLENIGELSVLITQLKNLSWTKIKILLNQAFDEKVDLLDFESQDSLDKKADIFALKAEKDTY